MNQANNALSLPPLGAIGENDHPDAHSFLMGLAREAIDARQAFVDKADTNLNIYQFGHDPADGSAPDVVVNEIQNAIIATTDIQTKDPPAVTLEPVETGEPPTSYWSGPAQIGISLGIAPEQIMPLPDGTPPQPLDPLQALLLHQQATMGGFDDDWITDLNDELISDTYQVVFDVFWKRCGADRRIRSNLLKTNIYGWTCELYEFDDEQKTHRIRTISIKQVYLDPTVEDIEDAAYCGIDLVLDANEAKKIYPTIAAEIEEKAHIGFPQKPDGQTDFGQAWEARNFYRPIIELRVFWLRNQPQKLPMEQALGAGQIEQRPVPQQENENALEQTPTLTQPGTTGQGADPQASGAVPDHSGPDASGMAPQLPPSTQGQAEREVSDAQEPAGTAPVVSMRPALFLPGSQDEVTPDHPDWPTRPCLRQITMIAGIVVDDRVCEHWDIPILHNVNIPIPGRPFGQGEPERLKALQDAENKFITAIVENARYFGHPLVSMPESVYNELKAVYGTARVGPGRTLKIPDEMWMAFGGKVDAVADPPQIPPGLAQALQILGDKFEKMAGQPGVLQGEPPPDVQSGKAIQALQTAVMSTIGFKSQRTGDFCYRLARLMLHSLVWRLSLQDVGKIISKYPPHILEAIVQRAQSMDWDVNVTIASGSGQVKVQKNQETTNLFATGLITKETAQERLNIDTRIEKQREQQEAEQMMQAQAQAAAMMPQQQQGNKPGGKPPSNGNGSPAKGRM